jgi:hypothetical protein
MKASKKREPTVQERDLSELLELSKRSETRVADAIVTVLCRADARTLAALGLIIKFVATRATRSQR